MGKYGRRRLTPGGRYEYATPYVAKALDTAVDKIMSHVVDTGETGVYDSAGVRQGPATDPALAGQLERRRIKVTPSNTGALIAVAPGEDIEGVRDRIYLATPRMGELLWVEQVLYAAVGIGRIQPIPTRQIETLAEHVKLDTATGRFEPRVLAADAAGLREILGLPTGTWTATADAAAERGRQAYGPLRPSHHDVGLIQLTRLQPTCSPSQVAARPGPAAATLLSPPRRRGSRGSRCVGLASNDEYATGRAAPKMARAEVGQRRSARREPDDPLLPRPGCPRFHSRSADPGVRILPLEREICTRGGDMIDDGPLFKFMLARSLKRYELRLAAWPWPPSRGGADWESYLRVQFERIVLEIGVGIRKLIENNKVSTELQARSLATRWMPIRRWGVIPTRIDNHHIERFYRTDSSWQKGLSYHKFCGDLVSWVGTVCEVEDLFGPMPDFARYAERGIGRGTARVVVGADEVVGAGLLSRAMTGRCHVPTRDHADVRRGRCVPKLTVVRSGEPFIGRAVVVELVQCRS